MAEAKHVRFYDNNGGSMAMHVKRELAEDIKEHFHPKKDYSAEYNHEKETLTIFIPRAPQ